MKFTAFDTETALIRPGVLAPSLCCVSFCDESLEPELYHVRDVYARLESMLVNDNIVGHNVAFDMAVIISRFPDFLPLVFEAYRSRRVLDTMINEQLEDIANGEFRGAYRAGQFEKRSYSLAAIAQRRLGKQLDKSSYRLGYGDLIEVPISDWEQGAKDYAKDDALTTYQIAKLQAPQADAHAQTRAAFALHLMSCWGIRTDPAYVEVFMSNAQSEIEQLRDHLRAAGYIQRNGAKNSKMVQARVLEILGPNAPRTPKGSVKADSETLQRTGDPDLVAIDELKKQEKISSVWFEYLKQGTTTSINPRFNPLVESGRTSCSNPNLQNPHRAAGLRECFVARPGFLFAFCDYSALEMCTLAQVLTWLFQSSNLAEALNRGLDPHLSVASQLANCTYTEAEERLSNGDKRIKELRQVSKALNFGLPGGMSATTFIKYAKNYGINLTQQQAEKLKADWLKSWPEMRRYFNYISSQTKMGEGQIVQFKSNRVRGGVSFTQAANSYFQGLAADGAKDALFQVANACYNVSASALYGSRPVAFIHDEIICEVPEWNASNAADELARLMRVTMQEWTPDIPIKTTVAIAERWYKEAEEVRNDKGELKPWTPSS